MNVKYSLLATALGIALAGSVSAASISASEAAELMHASGYKELSQLELRNDSWFAMGRDRHGELVEVRVDGTDRKVTWTQNGPRTTVTTTTTSTTPEPVVIARADTPVVVEEVIEVPVTRVPIMVEKRVLVPAGGRISKNEVRLVLAAAGYHDIHDIDWLKRRGVWKAEARDPSGDDLEIHVDPIDGRILHVEDD